MNNKEKSKALDLMLIAFCIMAVLTVYFLIYQ